MVSWLTDMKTKPLLLLLIPILLTLQNVRADHILVIGDSLSAAYGMPVEQGWVQLLQQRLAREKPPHTLTNASISGDTTASARARLTKIISEQSPDIVIIEIGGNDALRGLSLTAMHDNLADMIKTAQRHKSKVLLIGVDIPPNYGPVYTEKFRSVYRELAREYQIELLPSLVEKIGKEPQLMQADGIHPNGKAQPLMVEMVEKYLMPMLQQSN